MPPINLFEIDSVLGDPAFASLFGVDPAFEDVLFPSVVELGPLAKLLAPQICLWVELAECCNLGFHGLFVDREQLRGWLIRQRVRYSAAVTVNRPQGRLGVPFPVRHGGGANAGDHFAAPKDDDGYTDTTKD